MRLTFLTHYFPPEVGAPQARISALARALAERGLTVTVHTCPPHYPDGVIRAPYGNPLLQREERDGYQVVRSAVYPVANAGFGKRLANHLSFAGSALATAPRTPAADVVVAETPPLFLAAAAIAYSRGKRAGLVLNVADRWPASAVELGVLRDGYALRVAEALERACYRAARVITVPTEGLTRTIEALPVAAGKVVHAPPAVDLDRFDPSPARTHNGPLRVAYAGTLGLAQGVGTLVEAARRAGPDVVDVRIAGGGAEAAAIARASDRLPNVHLEGIIESERVPDLYAAADAGVVLLRNRPLFEAALPTKILEALAASRPVIVSAAGEAADLVERHGVGIAVPPEDPAALAAAFERLQQAPAEGAAMGNAARRLAEERFGRDAMVERWLAVLERAA